MANCCTNGLNQVFCNAFNKYYNTLYTNGEISKEETNNLLIIDYIRLCLSDDRYSSYYNILLKALRCIANNSCLLDTSWLYDRSIVPKVTNEFVTILSKQPFVEKDPIFMASPAATITQEEINLWNNPQGSGALIVTLTLDGTFSADYTYTEILEAWNNGLDIVLKYTSSGVTTVYQLQYLDSGSAYFFRVDNFSGPYLDYFALDVDGNTETWSKSTVNLQTKLTFDNNPTQGSNNPVKSSGIYNICPIIEDTRSQATDVNITGAAPFATLAGGQRIVLHFKYANTASPTLQLTLSGGTTTSAYPLYQNYNNGVSTLTVQAMPTGSYGEFVFDSTNSRWMLIGKDFNTTYAHTSQTDINSAAQGSRLIEPKLIHDNAYIVSLVYSSGSLKANKMYDFGTVSTALTIPSLDATNDLVSNALNFYTLRFIAGADNLSITFPTGVIVDDEPTINTGDYVEIMINLYVVNSTNKFYASIKVWQTQ